MSDVDIHAPRRDSKSKVQIEEQQYTRRADFRDTHWGDIVLPEHPKRASFRDASVYEICAGVLVLILGLILLFRVFFVAEHNKTLADRVGAIILFGIIGFACLTAAGYYAARVIKSFRENKVFILPNGFPISINTILNNYQDAAPELFNMRGYYDVQHERAGNPIVAPGEITYTHSPQNTYAPSNMPREKETDDDDEMLEEMLNIEPQEVELQLPEFVNFFDHLDEREQGNVIIGVDGNNEIVQVPIMKMFNHLVGGAIGTGKSVYLRSLVFQLIAEADESDVPLQIGLADIENNTFPEFRTCRHVRWYASNYVEIEHMTSALLREVEERKMKYEALSSTPKDIERYNVLAAREGAPELPITVVLYDEFSALMHRSQAQQKRILSDILQLALRARKYGIFLIIAGQTFKADLIDSAVLGQFNFNVAFKVRSGAASLSVIGQTGAEKLKRPGEALVKFKDGSVQHIQGLYLDDDELLDALKDYQDPDNEHSVPDMVKEIIRYSHEKMDDKVKFREIELHLAERGVSRADVIRYLEWMDEHRFILRGPKNVRMLNWRIINGG